MEKGTHAHTNEKPGEGEGRRTETGGYETAGTLSEHERERTGGERSEQDERRRAPRVQVLHYPLTLPNI